MDPALFAFGCRPGSAAAGPPLNQNPKPEADQHEKYPEERTPPNPGSDSVDDRCWEPSPVNAVRPVRGHREDSACKTWRQDGHARSWTRAASVVACVVGIARGDGWMISIGATLALLFGGCACLVRPWRPAG